MSCHGRLDEMNLTTQNATLLMEWCIACHREPEKHLRPKSESFSMIFNPGNLVDGKPAVWRAEDLPHHGKRDDGKMNSLIGQPRPTSQKELGLALKEQYQVRDAVTLTNCSMCHR